MTHENKENNDYVLLNTRAHFDLIQSNIPKTAHARYSFEHNHVNGKPLWKHRNQFLTKKFLDSDNDKRAVIQKMQQQCAHLYLALMPLYKLNIFFSIGLAGGSIRDLLLGQAAKVKDLDIVLSFEYNTRLPEKEHIVQQLGIDEALLQDWKIPADDLKDRNHVREFNTFLLVQSLLAQFYGFEQCYPPRPKKYSPSSKNTLIEEADIDEDNPDQTPYLQEKLSGVLKLNSLLSLKEENLDDNSNNRNNNNDNDNDNNYYHHTLSYPMDILITWHPVHDFVERFDFGICKAWIELVKSENSKLLIFEFPDTIQAFMEKLYFHPDFLNSFYNKVIVTDISYTYLLDVQSAFQKHLPRIIAKYPDYQIKTILRDDTWMAHEKIAIIQQAEKLHGKIMIEKIPVFRDDEPLDADESASQEITEDSDNKIHINTHTHVNMDSSDSSVS
jgi:hypothetical protein